MEERERAHHASEDASTPAPVAILFATGKGQKALHTVEDEDRLRAGFTGSYASQSAGTIGGAFMLGGCAAYVLTKMLHKPAAPPAQEVPAHALAHVLTDVETVSVSSVQMAEVPRKVMSL